MDIAAEVERTLIPPESLVNNLYVRIWLLTAVTLSRITECRPSSRGSSAVRSSWLRLAFAELVCAILLHAMAEKED